MLEFIESDHSYWVDGVSVPGVTDLLRPITDYSKVPPDLLARGQQMGTAVHRLTELYDRDDLDMDSLDPIFLPYLDAWKKFRSETGFVPDTIEHQMHHPTLRYAGTSDRTGIVKGEYAVIDIKKMMVLGPQIGVQLAAYAELHKSEGRKVKRRYALGLRPDGTYRLVEYTEKSDWTVFVSLLNLRSWREKHNLKGEFQ